MPRPTTKFSAWRYYAGFYHGQYLQLAAGVLAAVLQPLALLPIGLLIGRAFDVAIPAGDLDALALIGAAVLLLFLVEAGIAMAARLIIVKVAKLAVRRMRDDLLLRASQLSQAYYDRSDLARLHASLVHDTERVDALSTSLGSQLLPALITVVGLGLVLVYLSPALFLVMAAVGPVMAYLNKTLGSRVRERIWAYHRSVEKYSRGVLFLLQNMRLVRIQSADAWEMQRQRAAMDKLQQDSTATSWLNTAYASSQQTAMALTGVVIMIVGGRAVVAGQMSVGDVLGFFVTVGIMRTHVQHILASVPNVIAGQEAIKTLAAVVNADAPLPYHGSRRLTFSGAIRFEGVSFAYGEAPLLRELSLEIRPGRLVAVAGPNGIGKTTLVNLLLGLYRPRQGRLLADGQPYDTLDVIDLRRQIGVVMQDPIMLAGTVWDNITYGTPEADDNVVRAAARLAMADEFIGQLPDGYQSFIGDSGVMLSGGQRQRLALARALLRQPRLLILDEPTNHLDQAAITRLLGSLRRLPHTPAVLIISHNLEVLRHADEVYHLQDGRLQIEAAPAVLAPRSEIVDAGD